MTEGKTDHEILDGSPVVTTFNGKRYVWRQQMRREQRNVRSRLMDIAVHVAPIMSAPDIAKAALSIDAVNMILNLAEDYCPEMLAKIDLIEDSIRRDGLAGTLGIIEGVYQPLVEAWLEPWLRPDGEDDTGKPQDEAST